MREGIMFYNSDLGRMDIKFPQDTSYGGVHCGEAFQILVYDAWINVRIEYDHSLKQWYLIQGSHSAFEIPLEGLSVRI